MGAITNVSIKELLEDYVLLYNDLVIVILSINICQGGAEVNAPPVALARGSHVH
jgi:hypothetical protein